MKRNLILICVLNAASFNFTMEPVSRKRYNEKQSFQNLDTRKRYNEMQSFQNLDTRKKYNEEQSYQDTVDLLNVLSDERALNFRCLSSVYCFSFQPDDTDGRNLADQFVRALERHDALLSRLK